MKKKEFRFNTPILFLVFNRFEEAKRVFKEIKRIKPKLLFIASDGPRINKPGEKEIVEKIRTYLLKNITWRCKVKKLFRDENLGCGRAVSEAINWYFDNVKEGIILEDDCLPSQSFFIFCQEMLKIYRKDERVASIFGMNAIPWKGKESYKFHIAIGLWGWASWRRAWKEIYFPEQEHMKGTNPKKYIREIFPNIVERINFGKKYLDHVNGRVDTWEFPWQLGIIRRGKLNIIPRENLISNIGLGEGFTNTQSNTIDKRFFIIPKDEMYPPYISPKKVKRDEILRWRYVFRDYRRVVLKRLNNFFRII